MDSRIMRQAMLLALGALLLILLAVYAANKNTHRSQGPQAAAETSGTDAAQQGASGAAADDAYLHTVGEGFRAYGEQIGNQPKAFMYDENFFDPMRDVVTGIDDGSLQKLSLEAVASEGGIHVSVTNIRGGLEEGVAFQAVLEEAQGGRETTWTDTDRDGRIDITGLKSGNYRVRLIAVPGYEMPETPATVKVETSARQDTAPGQNAAAAGSDAQMTQQQDPVPATGQEVWDHAE